MSIAAGKIGATEMMEWWELGHQSPTRNLEYGEMYAVYVDVERGVVGAGDVNVMICIGEKWT